MTEGEETFMKGDVGVEDGWYETIGFADFPSRMTRKLTDMLAHEGGLPCTD
jgi:hypothetical protein